MRQVHAPTPTPISPVLPPPWSHSVCSGLVCVVVHAIAHHLGGGKRRSIFSTSPSRGRVLNERNSSRMIKAKKSTESCPFSVCNSQITEMTTFRGLHFYISPAIIPHFHLSLGGIASLRFHCTADAGLFSLLLNLRV